MAMKVLDAARKVLREEGSLHYSKLAKEIIDRNLVKTEGKTFDLTVNARISKDIQTYGQKSKFTRVSRGIYGLRENTLSSAETSRKNGSSPGGVEDMESISGVDQNAKRVRVPWFPAYSEVRILLEILQGIPDKSVSELQSTMYRLSGTPRDQMDWKNPSDWIGKLLDGDDRDLANRIWKESKFKINPRNIRGHWRLCKSYGLLKANEMNVLKITDKGRDFRNNECGDTIKNIDAKEGLFKLMSIVEILERTRATQIIPDWKEYLMHNSMIRSPSYIRDALRLRLNNLMDRNLLKREGNMYSLTRHGEGYLSNEDPENYQDDDEVSLRDFLRKYNRKVRENLQDRLREINPSELEHLVKNLLEAMGYQSVEVTKPSGDGGVDVVGDVEVGITNVKEVVQVKRYKHPIQRRIVAELRGSLGGYSAIRGTIITTSRFSSGAIEMAKAEKEAPITLIDGEKLVDLMIEHGIGVSKQNMHILTIDDVAFSESNQT